MFRLCDVKLAGDSRADSPGYTAKYGIYSLIERTVNRVVDVRLVQSNEVASIKHIKLEVLKRALKHYENSGIQVHQDANLANHFAFGPLASSSEDESHDGTDNSVEGALQNGNVECQMKSHPSSKLDVLKRALKHSENSGIQVDEVVTDGHCQVEK
ncbi:hypothetical protein HPB50_009194 [Hyalomma asiaticum]|uniref:Uncharacterized protein n=1 Tax=Hyalomma asiaticum TaxID=266040 RepID=A0ACB7SFC6_HYAAI|nr:hypothetical protein HPB50_009194 [Hyalomma asiaticum]